MDISIEPVVLVSVVASVVILLVVYYVFLVRALIEMIRLNAPGVVIVFTYLSLIPFPFLLILGILNLIIWHFLRKDMMATRGS